MVFELNGNEAQNVRSIFFFFVGKKKQKKEKEESSGVEMYFLLSTKRALHYFSDCRVKSVWLLVVEINIHYKRWPSLCACV